MLRAKDRCAPGTIRDWAMRAKNAGAPDAKTERAWDDALEFETWQRANGSKVPD